MSRVNDTSKRIAGALSGLDDNSEPKESKRVKEEKKNKKIKRSYMLSKSIIQKLKLLQIQEVKANLSELVEEAIELLYQEKYDGINE